MEETRLMTVKEASEMLRISKTTVYLLAQKGQIPCCKIGGRRLFRTMDILGYINSSVEGI